MEKNSKQRRRFLVAVAIIAVVTLTGLLVMNTAPASANGQDEGKQVTQQIGNEKSVQEVNQPFYSSALPSLARMIGALLVVIVCIYLGLYLLKRTTMKRYSKNGGQCMLEVLETVCVAPKKTVSLIKVANKAVLVGMTDNQMSVLTELDADQTAEMAAAQNGEKETDRFAQLLKSVSHRIRQVTVKKNQADLKTQPARPVT